jgi:outer membrane lipoprotein-sorting protein
MANELPVTGLRMDGKVFNVVNDKLEFDGRPIAVDSDNLETAIEAGNKIILTNVNNKLVVSAEDVAADELKAILLDGHNITTTIENDKVRIKAEADSDTVEAVLEAGNKVTLTNVNGKVKIDTESLTAAELEAVVEDGENITTTIENGKVKITAGANADTLEGTLVAGNKITFVNVNDKLTIDAANLTATELKDVVEDGENVTTELDNGKLSSQQEPIPILLRV